MWRPTFLRMMSLRPNLMVLLTVSKEQVCAEAGNSALTSSVHDFLGLAENVAFCAGVYSALLAFFAYTPSAESQHLPCKRRMVIASAEFVR